MGRWIKRIVLLLFLVGLGAAIWFAFQPQPILVDTATATYGPLKVPIRSKQTTSNRSSAAGFSTDLTASRFSTPSGVHNRSIPLRSKVFRAWSTVSTSGSWRLNDVFRSTPRPVFSFHCSQIGAGNADSEGYLGAVQVELGSNDDQFFRGAIRSAAHVGLCSLGASVALDGELVIDGGRFVGSLGACQPGEPTAG